MKLFLRKCRAKTRSEPINLENDYKSDAERSVLNHFTLIQILAPKLLFHISVKIVVSSILLYTE